MAERENTGAKIQSGNGGLSVRSGLSGNELKVIAIIAMAADHLAWTLWPGYANKEWWLIALHLFGRLAAPTMWFMISAVPAFVSEPTQRDLGTFLCGTGAVHQR